MSIFIPGYQITKELGSGGMATVYHAIQESVNRDVALKIMAPALAADRSFSERFLKEAKIVADLQHSNIVSVYDMGVYEHHNYIVMEYIECGDLKHHIENGISLDFLIDAILDIANALSFAHEKGYIHRDVKSENILFRTDGSAVLSDFGIAKAVVSGTKMTGTGLSIGTPHYMSPEQARGKDLDGRADFYSLGIVFYEALTGTKPYESEDTFAIGMMHINEPIPVLPEPFKNYQPILDNLCAKNPDDRYSHVSQLERDINAVREGGKLKRPKHVTQAIKTAKDSPLSPLAWGVLGSTVAASLMMAVFFWKQSQDNSLQVKMTQEHVKKLESQNTRLQDNQNNSELSAQIALSQKQINELRKKNEALQANQNNPELNAQIAQSQKQIDELRQQNEALQANQEARKQELLLQIQKGEERIAQLKSQSVHVDDISEENKKKISDYITLANERINENKLTKPKGDSAMDYFIKVLDIEPRNNLAIEGMDKIGNAYSKLALRALNKGDTNKAMGYLSTGFKASPGNPNLIKVNESLISNLKKTQSEFESRLATLRAQTNKEKEAVEKLARENKKLSQELKSLNQLERGGMSAAELIKLEKQKRAIEKSLADLKQKEREQQRRYAAAKKKAEEQEKKTGSNIVIGF